VEDDEDGLEDDDTEEKEARQQADFVPLFMEDIASVNVADSTGASDSDDEEIEEVNEVAATSHDSEEAGVNDSGVVDESFFDVGDSSKAYLELQALLETTHIPSMGGRILKIMELMQLGKVEKGSLLPDGKFTSLNARWFGAKKKKKNDSQNDSASTDASGTYIERNSIVTMKCKQGRTESVESYRVLAIFSKHYNKWYIEWDSDRVEFQKGSTKYKILARMVQKVGGSGQYEEVELEKDGPWGPRAVYCLKHMSAIESVETALEEGTNN